MKRIYVNEEWCLGCHLCEYECAFANSGETNIVKAFKRDLKPIPRLHVEDAENGIHFAVSCRQCEVPYCVLGCITGALSRDEQGVIHIDDNKCIGCRTCMLMCPYGALTINHNKTVTKCELCTDNNQEPACVQNCPNNAIVFEERE